MHRLIVTSAAYRQSSRPDPEGLSKSTPATASSGASADAARGRDGARRDARRRRRARPGDGRAGLQRPSSRKATTVRRRSSTRRRPGRPPELTAGRSTGWARGGRTFLDAFDCPDPSTDGPATRRTTTPLQALTLMNNALHAPLAEPSPTRLEREAGPDADGQVDAGLSARLRPRPPETRRTGRTRRGRRPLRRGRTGPGPLQQQRIHLSSTDAGIRRFEPEAPVDRRLPLLGERTGWPGPPWPH